MNTKKATNSQLSKTESKKQNKTKQTTRTGNRIIDMEITWRFISWEREKGVKGTGIKKHNW